MQNSKNSVVLSTVSEENDADDLLSALSTMGTSIPKNKQKNIKTVNSVHEEAARLNKDSLSDESEFSTSGLSVDLSKKKSKFFFRVTESFEEEMARRQKDLEDSRDPGLVNLDAEVDLRKEKYSKELPPKLQRNIVAVREFFLKEIGPLSLAAGAGSIQAREVMQRTLNAPVGEQAFAQFERMLNSANTIKMARFITKYTGLSINEAPSLVASIAPKKEAYFFPNQPPDERRVKAKTQPIQEAKKGESKVEIED